MKKFCPKTLYPKPLGVNSRGNPHILFPNFGFTLIELLVVIAITVLLVGGGIAAYNNFNQNQILNQAATTLVTNLRDAQNRALSGEKDCSSSKCGGANAICDNASDDKTLDGWYMSFTASSYAIYGHCGGLPPAPAGVDFSTKTIPLSNVVISPVPTPILFKSLTYSTNISGSAAITLQLQSDPTKTKTITVYTSGEIKLQ